MILTEEEARTKWCPFVHHNSIPTEDGRVLCSVNRDPAHVELVNQTGTGMCLCIASDCMMWKWKISTEKREANTMDFAVRMDFANGRPFEKTAHNEVTFFGLGYCGLSHERTE